MDSSLMPLECICTSECFVTLAAAEGPLIAMRSDVSDEMGKLDEPASADLASLDALDSL